MPPALGGAYCRVWRPELACNTSRLTPERRRATRPPSGLDCPLHHPSGRDPTVPRTAGRTRNGRSPDGLGGGRASPASSGRCTSSIACIAWRPTGAIGVAKECSDALIGSQVRFLPRARGEIGEHGFGEGQRGLPAVPRRSPSREGHIATLWRVSLSGRRRHAPARTPFAPRPFLFRLKQTDTEIGGPARPPTQPITWTTASSPQTDGPGAAISRSRATTHEPALASNPALDRPAFVPRTTGRRREMTRTAGASNPQVRNQVRSSPQVARPGSRTLSRWRHVSKGPLSGRHVQQSPPARLLTDMSIRRPLNRH